MKKLFISCPMRGRTADNILKSMEHMHKIAEIAFDQELEVVSNYIPDNAPETKNVRIWYLGEAIKKLADADYFIGVNYSEFFHGCDIETHVARRYNIPMYIVDMEFLMPDAVEIERAASQEVNKIENR